MAISYFAQIWHMSKVAMNRFDLGIADGNTHWVRRMLASPGPPSRISPPQHKTIGARTEAEAWARNSESELDRGVFASRVEAERTTLCGHLV